jgi:hypothetical protein
MVAAAFALADRTWGRGIGTLRAACDLGTTRYAVTVPTVEGIG